MGADWFKLVTSHIRGASQGGRCPVLRSRLVRSIFDPAMSKSDAVNLVLGIMVVLNLVGMTIAAYYFMKRKK